MFDIGYPCIILYLYVPDNTVGIRTQRSGFNRHEQNVYLLPILVVDTGPPALSSTGTLTIHVCGCDPEGAIQSCNATAYVISASLSPGALIALLVCMLILIGKQRRNPFLIEVANIIVIKVKFQSIWHFRQSNAHGF